jgi:hypothetical protein
MRQIVLQVFWLCFCFCITMILITGFFKWDTYYQFITIRILGTDVVFQAMNLILSIWMFISFLLFLTKEFQWRYQRVIPSLVLLFSGTIFLFVIKILEPGWTMYPPLSSLGNPFGEFTYEKYQTAIWIFRIIVLTGMAISLIIFFKTKTNKLKN